MVDFLFFYPRKQKVYHTVGTFLQDGLLRYFLAFCFSTYPTQILLLVVVVSDITMGIDNDCIQQPPPPPPHTRVFWPKITLRLG